MRLTTRSTLAIALAAVLSASAFADPPTDATAPASGKDQVLRGPAVGQDGMKSDRPFVGKGGRATGPQLEQRVFFATLDQMDFNADLQAKVSGLRDDFAAKVAAYEKQAGPKRKALEESRKNAAPNQPPSDEFKKGMQALEAGRPKLLDVKAELTKLLTPEQFDAFKARYDTEMKRVRAEMTKRTAAEREAQKSGKPAGDAPKSDAPKSDAPKTDAPKDGAVKPADADGDNAGDAKNDDAKDGDKNGKKKDGKKKDGKKKGSKKQQNEEDDGDDAMENGGAPAKPSL